MNRPTREQFMVMSEEGLNGAIEIMSNRQGFDLIEAFMEKLKRLEAQLAGATLRGELEKTMPIDINVVEVQFLKMAINFTVNAVHVIGSDAGGS